MKIKNLIPESEYKTPSLHQNKDVSKCSANYKESDEKTLLFLLPGVKFDTYKFVDKYIKSKACAIVTEDISKFPKTKIPLIEVKNARRAFAYAMSAISEIN